MEMEGRRKFKDNDEKFNSTKQLTNVCVAVEGKSMVTNKTTVVAVEEKARSSPGKKPSRVSGIPTTYINY